MEISGKVLREVEFRDRLRGYDTDEVDEFLEKVAVAVDELRAQLLSLGERAERAERVERADFTERSTPERAPVEYSAPQPAFAASSDVEEGIARTLLLAQRAADLAMKEAEEASTRLLEDARS